MHTLAHTHAHSTSLVALATVYLSRPDVWFSNPYPHEPGCTHLPKLHFSMKRESNWWIWSRFHPILFVVWSINNPTYSWFKVDLVQQAYSSRNQQMLSGARKLYCGCGGLASKQCKGTVVYCLEIFFPVVKMRSFLRLMETSRFLPHKKARGSLTWPWKSWRNDQYLVVCQTQSVMKNQYPCRLAYLA